MSGERIVEWLFIPWETLMSSSYFDLASHKRKRKHVSPSCLGREGRQSTSEPLSQQRGCRQVDGLTEPGQKLIPKAPGV